MCDLSRFHQRALSELRAGRKASHWMWFVFPQLVTLGRSDTARHYSIADLGEVQDYLADRLRDAGRAMLSNRGAPPEAILGPVDALKLQPCSPQQAEVRFSSSCWTNFMATALPAKDAGAVPQRAIGPSALL